MTALVPLLAVLAGVSAVFWLVRRMNRPIDRAADSIDHAELEAAEREVRDLGAEVGPDDADDALPDWGPGAPKT